MSGSWSSIITTGLRSLPPGSTDQGSSTLPPGSHHKPPGKQVINVFSMLTVGPASAGVHESELWASDGSETQAMPVKIKFQEGC